MGLRQWDVVNGSQIKLIGAIIIILRFRAMQNKSDLIEAIDDILPQTQCGLCGFKGCRPYATTIAHEGEAIDRCPPGGIEVLHRLANLMHIDSKPMQANFKPKPAMQAKIREDECIGCTKCIQACPVDAIIGSAKQMHVVLSDECTGCELCVAPCPVDCIDMLTLAMPSYDPAQAKRRYEARQLRLGPKSTATTPKQIDNKVPSLAERQAAIREALQRAKQKGQA